LVKYCKAKNYGKIETISEIGSGLNDQKKRLDKVIRKGDNTIWLWTLQLKKHCSLSPIAADAVGRFPACKKSKLPLDVFWGAAELAQATLLSKDCKYLHELMYWQS